MNLLMLINTTGLDYDDRLRKEALSLHGLGIDVQIVAVEYANQAGSRMAYDHVPATTVRLRTRQYFARGSGLWLKALEMYGQLIGHVLKIRPDAIWFHNVELAGLIPLLALFRKVGVVHRLIWDQHELPKDELLHSAIARRALLLAMNTCDVVIVANRQRRDLLRNQMGAALHVPIKVMNNYPDQQFAQLHRHELPDEVCQWLDGATYVLAQGGANPNRHLEKLIAAVLGLEGVKLIVVGPYQQEQLDQLVERFGGILAERVLFTGFIPQMEMTPFIDHALASAIFYSMSTASWRLCAPNRLYQAICRGTPVLVSMNAPIREVVQKYNCGVVVDAESIQSIRCGLEDIVKNWGIYRDNALGAAHGFLWDRQIDEIRAVVEEEAVVV